MVFPYKDKEYRVEFWYGRYAYGNAYGAEIGIYFRTHRKSRTVKRKKTAALFITNVSSKENSL
ncbi:DUF4474 domain-containing protein [Treponema socranskii subsp. buccale]|uniref:DUF4474 domain-containing protein n=1 Tax=Treponema socranskii TaxID=53419 RepID=UPI00220E6B6F|nr:DUF4474 domain-containing protein [Treponema socranskii subsp. buccale]